MASNKSEEEKYLIHEEFQLKLSTKKKKLMVKVAEQKVHQLELQLFNLEESFITEQEDYAQRCHQRELVCRAQRHGMTLIQISITYFSSQYHISLWHQTCTFISCLQKEGCSK